MPRVSGRSSELGHLVLLRFPIVSPRRLPKSLLSYLVLRSKVPWVPDDPLAVLPETTRRPARR